MLLIRATPSCGEKPSVWILKWRLFQRSYLALHHQTVLLYFEFSRWFLFRASLTLLVPCYVFLKSLFTQASPVQFFLMMSARPWQGTYCTPFFSNFPNHFLRFLINLIFPLLQKQFFLLFVLSIQLHKDLHRYFPWGMLWIRWQGICEFYKKCYKTDWQLL